MSFMYFEFKHLNWLATVEIDILVEMLMTVAIFDDNILLYYRQLNLCNVMSLSIPGT